MHQSPLVTHLHCAAVFLHLHLYKLVLGHLFGRVVSQWIGKNTLEFKA